MDSKYEKRIYINYIRTSKFITIICTNSEPITVHSDDKRFKRVLEHLENKDYELAIREADFAVKLEAFTQGDLILDRKERKLKGTPQMMEHADAIIEMLQSDNPLKALLDWKKKNRN